MEITNCKHFDRFIAIIGTSPYFVDSQKQIQAFPKRKPANAIAADIEALITRAIKKDDNNPLDLWTSAQHIHMAAHNALGVDARNQH